MPKDRKRDDLYTYDGYLRKSYDEIPQPKGKFVDLFEEMRRRNEKTDAERPQGEDTPSR